MRGPIRFSNNIVNSSVVLNETSPVIANYFETHKTLHGQYINSSTVVFSKGFAVAPNGQPPPTQDNFDFYVNGTLIERIGIVSFTNNITTSTLIVDPIILGFTFESTDKILAIGKFN